jgi:hypothetical protein
MPSVIYQATPGALIAQPDRAVNSFTSGLLRVDQTFICPTTAESTHRATLAVGNDFPLDDSPAIDGLKIFPDVQEIRRGDGFTEFKVSGYGRTSDTLRNVIFQQRTIQITSILRFKVWEISGEIALPSGTPLTSEAFGIDQDWLVPFDFFYSSTDWQVQSINLTTSSFVVGTATSAGGSTTPSNYQLARKFYAVTMRDSVNDTTVSFTVSVLDPIWEIQSQSNFGNFVEINVIGTRDQPTSTNPI